MLKRNIETLKAWQERSRQKQRDNPKRRVALRKMSKKRVKESKQYAKQRRGYLAEKPHCALCEACGIEMLAADIHHRQGRGGDLYLDESRWIGLCSECHIYIHSNPEWAKFNGWMLSRHTKDER